MGQWGAATCSGDGCWDCLYTFDVENHNSPDIDRHTEFLLNKGLTKAIEKGDISPFNFLGCIVWGLIRHCRIDIPHLESALMIAKEFLKSDLSSWKSPARRRAALRQEIRDIKQAIKLGGKTAQIRWPSAMGQE